MAFSANLRSPIRRFFTAGLLAGTALLLSNPALAHVGSPDIYAEGIAGPYKLFVTVRPPLVIPGVAEIEVRAVGPEADGITGIDIAPIPLVGEASKHPPVADAMKQSSVDKHFYTGALWIMASGSWQVRFSLKGARGAGVLSIPVPATSSSTKGMDPGLSLILGVLGLLLVVGIVGIVGAATRDAQLAPGAEAPAANRRQAWLAMGAALVLLVIALWLCKLWWQGEADAYAEYVYKPLQVQTTLVQDAAGRPQLKLRVLDPGWIKSRKVDDFVLDHDHLMHLYLIRQPGMDLVYHLHPDQIASGQFQLTLPSLPAATYKLYADVVHATGFPETLVTTVNLPEIHGHDLTGDNARGIAAAPVPGSASCTGSGSVPDGQSVSLADGYIMTWIHPSALPARTPEVFEFSLNDPQGKPPADMALYMGMVGHAAFVKDDGTVFAHVHPSGTVSMAAMMMAAAQNQPQNQPAGGAMNATAMEAMPGMESGNHIPNVVGFPFGFPTPGPYRIFIQMKHGQTIETGSFDACALPTKL